MVHQLTAGIGVSARSAGIPREDPQADLKMELPASPLTCRLVNVLTALVERAVAFTALGWLLLVGLQAEAPYRHHGAPAVR